MLPPSQTNLTQLMTPKLQQSIIQRYLLLLQKIKIRTLSNSNSVRPAIFALHFVFDVLFKLQQISAVPRKKSDNSSFQ